jgi:putative ABC transport system ATP-binding protein
LDILLSDINKSYDDSGTKRVIFKGMEAKFLSGRAYAVVGKSGVGKSSLLNLISGIDTPDSGNIRIANTNLSDMGDAKRTAFRRRHIGFIYQFFNLIPVLSVLENVTLVAELDGVSKDVYRPRAEELLRTAGLFDRQNDFPDKLSGGEQQRVAVVRALVNKPAVILADEPTGNLDSKTGKAVLDMISNLAKQSKATLIMVTHSLEASDYADDVMRVEQLQLISEFNRLRQ